MAGDLPTHADRIIRSFKNGRYTRYIFISALTLSSAFGFYSIIPQDLKNAATAIFAARPIEGGWLFLGTRDKNSAVYWRVGPYAYIIGSDIDEPFDPFPRKSRIILNTDREVIVSNFSRRQMVDVSIAPPTQNSEVRPEDRTGTFYSARTELVVLDQWIGRAPGSDYQVWVRVRSATSVD